MKHQGQISLLGLALVLTWNVHAQSFVSDNQLRIDLLATGEQIAQYTQRSAALRAQHNRLQTELRQLNVLLTELNEALETNTASTDDLKQQITRANEKLDQDMAAIIRTHNRQLGRIRLIVQGADGAAYADALRRYGEHGDIASVLDDLRSIVELGALSRYAPLALFRAGRILYEQNQLDEARVALTQLIKSHAGSVHEAEAMFLLAELELLQGNSDVARQWQERLFVQYPSSASANLLEKSMALNS